MKTAISLPDSLFNEGEQLAEQLGMSRSELYATALRAYIRQRDGARITQQINAVVESVPRDAEDVLRRLTLASMGPDEGPLEDWFDIEPDKRRKR